MRPGPGCAPTARSVSEIWRDYAGGANVWRGDVARMSAAAPVKHAAGVSYRLDIHDHCRQCQSVYGHVERGLESESLCSVSGDGFLGEITFHSFPTARCTVVWMCNL